VRIVSYPSLLVRAVLTREMVELQDRLAGGRQLVLFPYDIWWNTLFDCDLFYGATLRLLINREVS